VNRPDAGRYLEQQVRTATPVMLTTMLFDALVASSLRGLDRITESDPAGARGSLIRAQEIVLELRSSLNHDIGGEMARNLDRLYEFVYHNLLMGSTTGKAQPVQAAIQIATSLRDSWREACAQSAVSVP
jgi:flagellar secretion chaperone FliS